MNEVVMTIGRTYVIAYQKKVFILWKEPQGNHTMIYINITLHMSCMYSDYTDYGI
jgi:hypothetical protein